MEIAQHGSRDVTQPPRDPVALHGRTHRLGDDQPDAWTVARTLIAGAPDVHDEVGLHGAHPVPHRLVELG